MKQGIEDYDCRCKFDLEKHKAKYINYLEIVILEDGTVEYAVPSHQLKLMDIAMKKLGKTREEIGDMCPKEFYAAFNEWLCDITNTVSVHTWLHMGYCNNIQKEVLQKLKDNDLYTGEIHTEDEKGERLWPLVQ